MLVPKANNRISISKRNEIWSIHFEAEKKKVRKENVSVWMRDISWNACTRKMEQCRWNLEISTDNEREREILRLNIVLYNLSKRSTEVV